MKMEWLRAGDSTPACWASFLIFDDHAEVLAVIGANERIDGRMTLPAARQLWSDLKQRGWYRVTEEENADQSRPTNDNVVCLKPDRTPEPCESRRVR